MADFLEYRSNPTNPAELAASVVDLLPSSGWEVTAEEYRTIERLDAMATAASMDGFYIAETFRALALPVDHGEDGPVRFIDFGTLVFEGKFRSFSYVRIGKLVSDSYVRALCLVFDRVTLLPYFDTMDEDHLLHVPALAVDSMSRVNC